MTHIYKRGFTLIELLVVIAIIGILAGIVLASLGNARSGATGAKIKEEMSSMRAAAEVYYGSNNNAYSATTGAGACDAGMFNDANSSMKALVDSVQASATAVDCASSATAWSVAATIATSPVTYWCVDSTGVSRGATSAGTAYAGLQASSGNVAHLNASANTATACN